MAIGGNIGGSVSLIHRANGSPGSVRADWDVLYDDATTASTSGDWLNPSAIDNSGAHRVTVPDGATRVLIRARYDVGADTFTASPVIHITGTDSNGVPLRCDDADANAAGITVTCEASTAVSNNGVTAGTHLAYSNVTTLDGYDIKGATYLYITVATAANVLDGGVQLEVAIMGLFLN